jgi:hypothetical protein
VNTEELDNGSRQAYLCEYKLEIMHSKWVVIETAKELTCQSRFSAYAQHRSEEQPASGWFMRVLKQTCLVIEFGPWCVLSGQDSSTKK